MMESVWANVATGPEFEALDGERKTDVLIIGGGMAGLLCAHRLKEAGVDHLLVEASRICGGVTQGTTAKITAQHGLIYGKLIRIFGKETAQKYLEANLRAVEQYTALCKNIDCDYQQQDSFVYSLDDPQKIEDELEALQQIGYPARLATDLPLPFHTVGAVQFPKQAQFHPLKFAYTLAKDLNIFENTRVLEVTRDGARTATGFIRAKKIIVATHFPFINKHGSYFLKLYQHRSYVLALRNGPDVKGMYLDEGETGLSFRNYNGLLLLGGGSHRTGKSGGGWNELTEIVDYSYPKAKEIGRWATQDCMSLDGIPYIGPYSKNTPDLYVATGFNKWGMTASMVAAELLKDQIFGKENEDAVVFSPSRSILRPQLAINAGESVLHLMKPTLPRCPHMGCALKYNRQERSWDCPCHGSRFTKKGVLIDNPANGDLKK